VEVSMSEKEYDSSVNKYIVKETPEYYEKQLQWDMAIGLQEVDNLKPSSYLEKLMDENISGNITVEQVKKGLRSYYEEKGKKHEIDYNEMECDLVSTRIVEFLNIDDFELSADYFLYVHKYIFQDVFGFAGKIKERNLSKPEPILNRDTVRYGDFKTIFSSLEYDISLESAKDYKTMNIVEVINSITDFSSSIWQIHPFEEGNTRATAVFIQKYLVSLGYEVFNSLFKEKSVYFRNALVRSNYFNRELNIKEEKIFLIKFYENLLLGKNNDLHSADLIVEELFDEDK